MKKLKNFKMVGLDGNAFFLLGAFSKQAKREGWTQQEIDKVTKEATSGDYENLLSALISHCENPMKDDEESWIFTDEYLDEE